MDIKMAAKPASSRSKATPAPAAVPEAAPQAEKGATLKIKGLIERIAEKSSVKRKDLRDVVDVTLAELGAALAKGESVNLPGLGNLRVARKADNGMIILKLRQPDPNAVKEKPSKGEDAGKEALAEAGEAG
ncbi:HU family DNA-binding protein [Stagnihabitans tardus]|uniref:DNA-binding protein n=1 Tax=Stagnihabitans tardus TaxID=2699202 RepID=A0AAE5BX96_9RHOB|nr:HU family DNA-binding protein [Stagnihabitans tardus]NBZ89088.1 hypothetical protein [Stagnihabitans tardus]